MIGEFYKNNPPSVQSVENGRSNPIKKDSDIDLFFIVSSIEEVENYKEKIINALKLHPQIRKDFKVVSTKDFMEMLDQKYTVGREVFKNNLVLFGTEHYYSLVKEYVRTKGY